MSSIISGFGRALTKAGSGAGILTLSGVNTFSGATTVATGTLRLDSAAGDALGSTASLDVVSGAILLISQSNQVNDSASVSLSGGTIVRGEGVSETFGDLNIAGGSTLDFGTGAAGDLQFQAYSYTGSALIVLQNFLPGNRLQFLGTSFSAANLAQFDFGGFAYSSGLQGDYFTITAIPEPSAWIAAGLLLSFMILFGRSGRPSEESGPWSK